MSPRTTGLSGGQSREDMRGCRAHDSYATYKPHLDAGLRAFIDKARRYPLLTQEREREVAIAWRDRRDHGARDELAHSHLRLVVKIARGFAGYRLPLADMVAEGNIGLLRAIDKFDPEYGARFSTYAVWWIRAAIQAYVLRSWSLVRIGTTAAQRRLFFNLQRLKMQLQSSNPGNLTSETLSAIATKLEVRVSDVVEIDMRLNTADSSLNTQPDGESGVDWLNLLPDDSPDQETALADANEQLHRRTTLVAAMTNLTLREREIVFERHFREQPTAFEELSHRYAVTSERVRQIELKAVNKLRLAVATNCRGSAHVSTGDPPAHQSRAAADGRPDRARWIADCLPMPV